MPSARCQPSARPLTRHFGRRESSSVSVDQAVSRARSAAFEKPRPRTSSACARIPGSAARATSCRSGAPGCVHRESAPAAHKSLAAAALLRAAGLRQRPPRQAPAVAFPRRVPCFDRLAGSLLAPGAAALALQKAGARPLAISPGSMSRQPRHARYRVFPAGSALAAPPPSCTARPPARPQPPAAALAAQKPTRCRRDIVRLPPARQSLAHWPRGICRA